ncbi:hypothetical protein [Sulfuriflexus mobilis]|uniref:hypothetical protein n=1 Tax=Sulfuriflexus mobilis TaxID=1811807 RepID=UPI000F830C5A|nr:hypothetical protein [Sulfuriflexus mobilis]
MLKFLAHCWLILSLLIAPLHFAAADMAVSDHAEMKCESMDVHSQNAMQDSSMEHDMARDTSKCSEKCQAADGCECAGQCKVSCASAHSSLAMLGLIQFMRVASSFSVGALTTSIRGIYPLTELRPPIA